jgi:hypothetical protein
MEMKMNTKQVTATALKLDENFLASVKRPILQVWNSIGYDSLELSPRLKNAEAIEGCLDADRIVSEAKNPEAQKLLRAAYEAHGFEKVLRFLSKNIHLV